MSRRNNSGNQGGNQGGNQNNNQDAIGLIGKNSFLIGRILETFNKLKETEEYKELKRHNKIKNDPSSPSFHPDKDVSKKFISNKKKPSNDLEKELLFTMSLLIDQGGKLYKDCLQKIEFIVDTSLFEEQMSKLSYMYKLFLENKEIKQTTQQQ